ncbi:MAG TPA: helix-turn-helix domain-containing protein [Solirubrobacterales bacterium]|nr:helix-turn-helix domain-containing protein [Solirubrobacterales bacterium]
MVELVADRGYAGVTIRALVRTSEVSTSAFYRQFPDIEECFASTYRTILQRVRRQLQEVTVAGRRREDRLRALVRAALIAAAQNPHAARLVLVDCYDGGPAMLREIETETAQLEQQLEEDPAALPRPIGQAVVAGIEYVVRVKVLGGREEQLPAIADELADWVVRVAQIELRPEPQSMVEVKERHHGDTPRDPGFAAFTAIGGDRGRVLAAVAKLSADGGYWNLTLPVVRREAGVSRRNFDALFADLDHSYLEAVATVSAAAARAVVEETDETLPWASRLDELAKRFCDEVSRSPLLARLAFADVFAPGSAGLRCRDRLLAWSTRLLRTVSLSDQLRAGIAPDAAVAGAWRVLAAEIQTGAPPRRSSAPLMSELVLASTDFSTEPPIYRERERTDPRTSQSGARAR